MKRALIISGKLVQDHEFIYPYYRFKEEGFEVITALKDGVATVGVLGTNIPSDKDAKVISYENMSNFKFDILCIPGGAKSMEYLRQEQIVLDFIKNWNNEGKIIACICHGTQMLISARVVKGRKMSGYYSIKDDINNAGAEYINAPFVVDKNIITCPHYKYLGDWMKKTMEMLRNENIID